MLIGPDPSKRTYQGHIPCFNFYNILCDALSTGPVVLYPMNLIDFHHGLCIIIIDLLYRIKDHPYRNLTFFKVVFFKF